MAAKKLHQGEFEQLKDAQINVAVTQATKQELDRLCEEHNFSAPQVARRLLEGAVEYYKRWGHFHFPVAVVPRPLLLKNQPTAEQLAGMTGDPDTIFRLGGELLLAAAEAPGEYDAGPAPGAGKDAGRRQPRQTRG